MRCRSSAFWGHLDGNYKIDIKSALDQMVKQWMGIQKPRASESTALWDEDFASDELELDPLSPLAHFL
jgi:hypothetical protein